MVFNSKTTQNVLYGMAALYAIFIGQSYIKMKTTLKFILCILGVIAVSTQCKAQPSNYQHLIDSLKITDPDELAICKLYDDAVNAYFTEWKQYTTNGTKPTQAQTQALSKEFHAREQAIKPQIESFKKKVASNYQVVMNFAQFCQIEAMRVYGSMYPNMKGMNPGYPPPANH
jgi:hypothetical protein